MSQSRVGLHVAAKIGRYSLVNVAFYNRSRSSIIYVLTAYMFWQLSQPQQRHAVISPNNTSCYAPASQNERPNWIAKHIPSLRTMRPATRWNHLSTTQIGRAHV